MKLTKEQKLVIMYALNFLYENVDIDVTLENEKTLSDSDIRKIIVGIFDYMNKKLNRYIVEHHEFGVRGCETVEDLTRHLEKNPHPEYRLVNCQWISGTYQLVWELI